MVHNQKTHEQFLKDLWNRNKSYREGKFKVVGHTDDYFIIGSETHTTDIVDLRDIELEYSAAVVDGSVSYFRHNLQDMLIKAKEGFYPYINFKGFKVNRKPKLVIKGKVHRVHNNKIISYDE